MASLDNEIRLANLLFTVGDGEHEIEETREKLAKLPEFDPLLLFKLLDRTGKGHVTVGEIRQFFSDFDIVFSAQQVGILLQKSSADKLVTFDE